MRYLRAPRNGFEQFLCDFSVRSNFDERWTVIAMGAAELYSLERIFEILAYKPWIMRREPAQRDSALTVTGFGDDQEQRSYECEHDTNSLKICGISLDLQDPPGTAGCIRGGVVTVVRR